MCEFCPIVGHCIVCDSNIDDSLGLLGFNLRPGLTVEMDGVRVQFNKPQDALACLEANPRAQLT